MVNDEQIESHVESYTYPQKSVPMRLILLGTLRGLIIQPTRDTFSAMSLITTLNFLRSE